MWKKLKERYDLLTAPEQYNINDAPAGAPSTASSNTKHPVNPSPEHKQPQTKKSTMAVLPQPAYELELKGHNNAVIK